MIKIEPNITHFEPRVKDRSNTHDIVLLFPIFANLFNIAAPISFIYASLDFLAFKTGHSVAEAEEKKGHATSYRCPETLYHAVFY